MRSAAAVRVGGSTDDSEGGNVISIQVCDSSYLYTEIACQRTHLGLLPSTLWQQAVVLRVPSPRSASIGALDASRSERILKPAARLIGNLDPEEWELPPKPKWMRGRTYNRLAERFDAYDDMTYPDDSRLPALVAKLMRRSR
jgi:hypothetical protein